MITYNPAAKIIDSARYNLYKRFAQEKKKLENSDLIEEERKAAIYSLIEKTNKSLDILNEVKGVDEIPENIRMDLEIPTISEKKDVDENLVNTLVKIFADRLKVPKNKIPDLGLIDDLKFIDKLTLENIDTTSFEDEIRQYFTEHYDDLLSVGRNFSFFIEITRLPDEKDNKYGDLLQIAMKHNLDPEKICYYDSELLVNDGLVAGESNFGEAKVIYGTPEGINNRISQLYYNIKFREAKGIKVEANDYNILNKYIIYANEHKIKIEDVDVVRDLLQKKDEELNKLTGKENEARELLGEYEKEEPKSQEVK